MSKNLTRLSLALFAVSLCAWTAAAQTTMEWIVLKPAGAGFTARLPKQPVATPESVRAEGLSASGRRYTSEGAGGASVVVWSLEDAGGEGRRLGADGYKGWLTRPEVSAYLDRLAEVAWELLVAPEIERLTKEKNEEARKARVAMEWRYEFNMEGDLPARAYFLTLGGRRGPVYVCLDRSRFYVVAALAPDAQFPQLDEFAASFGFKEEGDALLPTASYLRDNRPGSTYVNGRPAVGFGTPPSPALMKVDPNLIKQEPRPPASTGGGDAPVDYAKPFKQSDVAKKAVITFKPEPGFTESARKFEVTGAVRLRAILSKTGEVTSISVIKFLPHGLTEKSIEAARRIRFEPAQKDGRAVSQYVVLEYHYDIY
jgi:TonB family protein